MSAKKTDIEQISKYLKQELDAHAMHVLEKQAQDDPFLMEAMEGFEHSGTDIQPAMTDLNQRLEQRIAPSRKQWVIGWRTIGIAASILLVLGIGGYWLNSHQTTFQQSPLTAQVDHVDKKALTPSATAPISTAKPETSTVAAIAHRRPEKIKQAVIASAETAPPALPVQDNQAVAANEDRQTTTQFNKSGRSGYRIGSQPDTSYDFAHNKTIGSQAGLQRPLLANATSKPDTSYNFAHKKVRGVQPVQQRTLLGKVDGATYEPIRSKGAQVEELALTGRVNGRVFSTADQTPIPGAVVNVYGKSTTTETDAQGYFSIKADKKDVLNVNSIGYQSRQLKANKDSLYISLQESAKALSEVVTARADKSKPVIEAAHPLNGWTGFDQYLKENAIAIDHHTGTVKLNFIVNSDGTLTDFNVIQKLDAASDNQAIALIKSGPTWLPNIDGKPHVVELKIRFHKN